MDSNDHEVHTVAKEIWQDVLFVVRKFASCNMLNKKNGALFINFNNF